MSRCGEEKGNRARDYSSNPASHNPVRFDTAASGLNAAPTMCGRLS
jgi:hypothetical protein